jgi:hypothetical protein
LCGACCLRASAPNFLMSRIHTQLQQRLRRFSIAFCWPAVVMLYRHDRSTRNWATNARHTEQLRWTTCFKNNCRLMHSEDNLTVLLLVLYLHGVLHVVRYASCTMFFRTVHGAALRASYIMHCTSCAVRRAPSTVSLASPILCRASCVLRRAS